MKNSYSGNFAYISGSYAYLKQAVYSTVKAGGKDFDTVLFTIRYDSDYGCYFISNYRTENALVCFDDLGEYFYLGEDYNYMYGDTEAGWYIRKTNDGYFQFVSCNTILSPKMMTIGTNLFDGSDIVVDEYDASSSTGKWSLFLAVNAINIEQQQINSCSAASLLQLLYSIGMESTVYGSTIEAKEMTLISELGLSRYWVGDPETGHWEYPAGHNGYVLQYLNNHSLGHSYTYFPQDDNSQMSDLINAILGSLANGSAAIGLFNPPNYLSYYPYNLGAGHFFSIAGINIAGYGEVLINDCTYVQNNPPYNGVHVESIQSLFNNITVVDYAIN